MVDVEVRRARVHFSVENRAKIRAGGLRVVKCSLCKTTLFWLSEAFVFKFK